MTSRDLVREHVYKKIVDLTGDHIHQLDEHQKLLAALGPSADDLSWIFVIELEKELNISTKRSDWIHVSTVGDAIDLFFSAFVSTNDI